ncbi:DUF2975 domain-containing protein [Erythrobacter sp. W53]|uniref:DUF2975 domain-containing protein n=1 Tax=Erythrobacter sp. W53 TaxID=3425947 RepID=UPI003D76A179
MKKILNDPLLTGARAILYITMAAIGAGIAALTAGIAIALIRPGLIFEELNHKVPIQPGADEATLFAGVFALMIILFALLFFFFRYMLRIVGSVAAGDPFTPINATRLTAMGWLMLAVQLVSIPAVALIIRLTNQLGEDPGTVDSAINFNGIILVITLFILARVFRQGSAMRDDLEGTV